MLDIERLKNKLAQLNSPDKKNLNSNTWNPPKKDGEKKAIRLAQYPHSEDPFPELWFHYKFGKQSILCPNKNNQRECPICELGRQMWQSGDPKDRDLAKLCFPQQRFYAVMFDRSAPGLTPKYWGFGVTVYKKLLKLLIDSRTRHMLDPQKGFDISVYTFQTQGKIYRETDFDTLEDSPLCPPEESKKLMETVKPLGEVFKPMTYSEIKKALEDHLNGPSFDTSKMDKEGSETSKGGEAEASEPEPTVDNLSASTIKDIENVFDQLAASSRK